MGFDADSEGPMFDWVLACLGERLVAMLETAGARELAARVDPEGVRARLPEVRAEMLSAAERGQPTPAASP